ncbi:MAG: uracil-DNA glycosylase, partial [Acidimicrobiales bacterium]
MDSLRRLEAEIAHCRTCPRLVAWRELVARDKRAAFRAWDYWGRPVPGFGDPEAHLLIVGLAPAAHGGNRTGRVFTGDRSGDFLYASLYRCGYANQPTSEHRDDGLRLDGCWITAAVKCAPPANKPTPAERDNCRPYLEREFALLPALRVVVALGRFGWDAVCAHERVRPRPAFGHGAEVELPSARILLGSYHPSQQNTFTGKITDAMLDVVFQRARRLAASRRASASEPGGDGEH